MAAERVPPLHPCSHYMLQHLLADYPVATVRQGNCTLLEPVRPGNAAAGNNGTGGTGAAGEAEAEADLASPNAVLLRFSSSSSSGDVAADSQPTSAAPAGTQSASWLRMAGFAAGWDFDRLVGAVADGVHTLEVEPAVLVSRQPSSAAHGGSHRPSTAGEPDHRRPSTAAAATAASFTAVNAARRPLVAVAARLTAELVAAGTAAAAAVAGAASKAEVVEQQQQHQEAAEETLQAVMAAVEGFVEAAGYGELAVSWREWAGTAGTARLHLHRLLAQFS